MQASNGDVIRVNRGLYSHFGIYIADGERVIHYTGATGPNDFNGVVRETSLEEFLNGAEKYSVCKFPEHPPVNLITQKANGLFKIWQTFKNLQLMNYKLYSPDETIARARSKLGQGGYNLALNNCEHFAVWCKTGVKTSSQVNAVMDFLTMLIGGVSSKNN